MAELVNAFEDLLEEPVVNEEVVEDNSDFSTSEVINPYDEVLKEPVQEEPETEETIEEESETEEVEYDNAIYEFLRQRGITDPSKIKFTNEDETEEELDFNALSKEEQLAVLQQVTDPGLTEDEIETINYLRRNRVTLQDTINYFAEQRLQAYLNEHPESVHQKAYAIDDYSDDELYLVSLKNQYPDFSDEELMSKLEAAKDNEELFKKETEIIRNTFKAQEDQEAADRARLEQQQVEDLMNNIRNAANQFNEIYLDYTDEQSDSLVIEEEDKQQMMSYILDQDADGKSQLARDLEDPDRLIELSWFVTQGPKVLSELTQYWKGLLSKEREENKKLQAKIDRLDKAKNNTVVVPTPPKNTEEKRGLISPWDNSGLL